MLGLINFGQHPIAHRLLSDPSEEEYVHAVDLRFCQDFGLTQLVDPIPPEMLYTDYNSLSSWKSQPHIPRLISLIEELPGLAPDSNIVEVGSNDGVFLEALRGKGYRRVLGIEPARDAREAAQARGLDVIGTYFGAEAAAQTASDYGRCDLLVARQVLEHITDLQDFREGIRRLLRPGGYVLIEVPDFDFSLDASDYSAIWEEHVNHFTLQTISRFLAEAGINVLHSETANFSGQALMVLGSYTEEASSPSAQGYLPELSAKAITYQERWEPFRQAFVGYLRQHQERSGQVAMYGGGCRACCLINFAGIGPYLTYVLDDQPEKQGKYLPGSHLPIVPGELLEEDPVDLCLLAVNAENEEKVMSKHREYSKNGGRFASVHPPSSQLLPIWRDL